MSASPYTTAASWWPSSSAMRSAEHACSLNARSHSVEGRHRRARVERADAVAVMSAASESCASRAMFSPAAATSAALRPLPPLPVVAAARPSLAAAAAMVELPMSCVSASRSHVPSTTPGAASSAAARITPASWLGPSSPAVHSLRARRVSMSTSRDTSRGMAVRSSSRRDARTPRPDSSPATCVVPSAPPPSNSSAAVTVSAASDATPTTVRHCSRCSRLGSSGPPAVASSAARPMSAPTSSSVSAAGSFTRVTTVVCSSPQVAACLTACARPLGPGAGTDRSSPSSSRSWLHTDESGGRGSVRDAGGEGGSGEY
mmetsp:Transcript_9791/g.24405  ORF Transcript_9791/g.24405 Transcript_9791/m.24405 type:complete len:316 (+) Transcript_9791:1775-2722(+)